jgi:hypothetical protein
LIFVIAFLPRYAVIYCFCKKTDFGVQVTAEYQATPLYAWLVGRHPKIGTLVIAGISGLLLGAGVVAANEQVWWMNVIVFALAFDLVAGFVSNLSHSTRTFWSSRSSLLRINYVLAHLTVYPLAIRELVSSNVLVGFLAAVLAAKVIAFIIGGLRNLRKPEPKV